MPPRKRFRDEFVAAVPPAEAATRGCPLPDELLLEIFARLDAATLIRCSASCRSLRRDIRRPAFIHRICNNGAVPSRLVGFLGLTSMPPPSFSLAHPATPAAASLAATHLAPSLCRLAGADAGRLAGYRALTSRDGLVLLCRRRWVYMTHEMTMCVYDAMTGKGTFFPGPPDAGTGQHSYDSDSFYYKFVLLTAVDGVGCHFLIISADFSQLNLWTGSRSVIVRTFSPSDSDGSAWSPAILASHCLLADKVPFDNATVVYGGFVHWIMYRVHSSDNYIFTYNVVTAAAGSIELPAEVPDYCRDYGKLHLASSSCGRRLSLLVTDKFKVTVWLLMSGDDGAYWARSAVIDTERTVSAAFEVRRPYGYWPDDVAVVSSGARSGAVLLLPYQHFRLDSIRHYECLREEFIILDLETEEMHTVIKEKDAFLYEVDLASRLSAMKTF